MNLQLVWQLMSSKVLDEINGHIKSTYEVVERLFLFLKHN